MSWILVAPSRSTVVLLRTDNIKAIEFVQGTTPYLDKYSVVVSYYGEEPTVNLCYQQLTYEECIALASSLPNVRKYPRSSAWRSTARLVQAFYARMRRSVLGRKS